jgi:non-ribosomal peptide synthetase component E (peptide arylation enzyme)
VSLPLTVRDRYRDDEIDSFYAHGSWGHEGLFDLAESRAATYGDKVFVSDGTTSVTYADLRDRAVRLAHGLTGLGIGRGDRVAVQLPNWTEFVTIAVALTRLGAVLVPIMPIYRAEEVGYVLGHSGANAAKPLVLHGASSRSPMASENTCAVTSISPKHFLRPASMSMATTAAATDKPSARAPSPVSSAPTAGLAPSKTST